MRLPESRWKISSFFILLGLIFYVPLIGGVHLFDWDEVNFAEIAREMILLEDYLRIYVNFEPFWEKPPFFFWLQAVAMKIFGIDEFAARLPNAVFGIITLVTLYNIGHTLYDKYFGFIWGLIYFGTVLPFLYFKSGIIDPVFNYFIFTGFFCFLVYYWKYKGKENSLLPGNYWWYLIGGGLLVGLGILTKGPVAYLVVFLSVVVYWIYQRLRLFVPIWHFILFSLATTVMTLSWYGLETWQHGPWFINEFNRYQIRLLTQPDAGHAGFPGYHFVVLLIGCFPASLLMIRSFAKLPGQMGFIEKNMRLWMKILFWVVLILFTIVESKIVHYSSLCYFPLTFLASVVAWRMWRSEISFPNWMKTGLIAVGSLYIIAIVALPVLGSNIEWLRGMTGDPFARAAMSADVSWPVWVVLPALILIAVIIWFFRSFDNVPSIRSYAILFGGTAIFVFSTLIIFINRIETFSQRAGIEFLKEHRNEKAYFIPHGFKTYMHLYYGRIQPELPDTRLDKERLLSGSIDRDVYVITKVHKEHELAQYKELREVGRKNGFVFFKREGPSEATEK